MDEDEYNKLKEADSDLMPGDFELPEDTTGQCLCLQHGVYVFVVHIRTQTILSRSLLDPTVVIDADGAENQKSYLKTLNFPVMDDADALASSYIPKVLTCLSKWSVKLHNLVETFDNVEEMSGNLQKQLISD